MGSQEATEDRVTHPVSKWSIWPQPRKRANGWISRARISPKGLLYSWWSYRARDWDAADKGRRLDHIWATPDISNAVHNSRILRDVRGWEQPSDHAPVFATFDL